VVCVAYSNKMSLLLVVCCIHSASLPELFAIQPPPPRPALLLFRAITPNNCCSLLHRVRGSASLTIVRPHAAACTLDATVASLSPPPPQLAPIVRPYTDSVMYDRSTDRPSLVLCFGTAVSQQGDSTGEPKNSSPKGRHSTKTLPSTLVPYM
jgi:hypothetical protein